MQISHNYMFIPFLFSLPLTHPYPIRLGSHRAPAGLPMLYSSLPVAVYFTHDNAYKLMLLSQLVLSSPSPTLHKSILYVCVTIPPLKNRLISTIF